MVGRRFGKLVAIAAMPTSKNRRMWTCLCDCGNTTVVLEANLKNGNTKSCGCLQKERTAANNRARIRHDMSGTPIYKVWLHIKDRCLNENNKDFKHYGGRGVSIDECWKSDFQAFYSYVSKLSHFGEKGYSLDRIDNNGDYAPNNVRWATTKEQGNNRRTNRKVEAFGEKHTVAEWSEMTGIKYRTLMARLNRGFAIEEALTKEVK